MKHPHAELFIAIANGESIEDFEASCDDERFNPARDWIRTIIHCPEDITVRRKAKTIKVNGFDVPAPCKEIPESGNMYAPSMFTTSSYSYLGQAGDCTTIVQNALKNGVLHTTHEAAAAHSKALLGIDPKLES